MKKIICMFLNLSLLVCIVGCSQAKDSDNHVVQDYSEEYEVSPYGSEEALDTLGDDFNEYRKGFRFEAPFISNRKYF